MKRLAWAGFVALALLTPARARAQSSPPQVQVQLEADTVGVGDLFHLQMSATSADDMPSDAQIGATPGVAVRAQNASPGQTHIIANGSRTDRYTLTVDWTLQAQRAGTFAIGPITVVVGRTRYQAQKATIHVVLAGQAPRRAPQPRPDPFGSPFSPFDPWRGLFPGMDDGRSPPPRPSVEVDPRMSLEASRGEYAFLHATVDKTTAVIGEQIIFTVYEFDDETADTAGDDVHEAQVTDFVKHPLVPEDREPPLAGHAAVAGRPWAFRIFRRWALFPIHSGDLSIGPMSLSLVRPRAAAGPRTTEPFVVRVVEAPLAGRPPGFSQGDVGRFAIAAQVQPRDIEQGAAVGVHVEVSGTGNLPEALTPPARDSIEWLAPEVHSELGATGQGVYGGKRSFDFVVHVKRAGSIDLGDLTLPFWDPEQRKYCVARAPLGRLQVKPSVAPAEAAKTDAPPERLAGLPPPRDVLEGTKTFKEHPDDSPLFWLFGVAGGPLALGAAVAGRAGARRARRAWVGRRASPVAELKDRVAAVRAACEANDPRAIDATITRALEAATVAHANIGIRGALGAEVVGRLERAGIAPRVAMSISDLLGECERARFAPEASDAVASRDRASRAMEAIRHLEKGA